MNHSTHVTWRGLSPTTELGAMIAREVEQLRRACPEVIRCDVLVDRFRDVETAAANHRVLVDVLVPGGWLIARNAEEPRPGIPRPEDAVEDAFEEAHARLLSSMGRAYRGSHPHRRNAPPPRLLRSTPPPSLRWIPPLP